MKFCTHCGAQLDDTARFCISCGAPQESPAGFCQSCGAKLPEDARFCTICGASQSTSGPVPTVSVGEIMDKITGSISQLSGGQGAVRPPLRQVFSKVFTRHSRQEAEEIFICGTASTTPQLTAVDTAWPQPWLFSRVLAAFALAFFMLTICCSSFGNTNSYPGTIFLGAFMVPFAVFIFFLELNAPKNISMFTSLKIFLVGGCASLLLTLLLFELVPVYELDVGGAIVVGVVEEIAKLALVFFFIYQEDCKHPINGLLIGAAVGAGFAAFESAGYAFNALIAYGYDGMLDSIFLRAVLAPGGHVVWAAMSGYALMLSKGEGRLSFQSLGQVSFWKVFWIPVTLHAIWDMPISFGSDICLVQVLLTLLSWVVILVFINNCLDFLASAIQVAKTAPGPQAAEPPVPPVPAAEAPL